MSTTDRIELPTRAESARVGFTFGFLTGVALVGALALALLVLTGCGSPTASVPPPAPAPVASTVNPVHASLCRQFKAKAEDKTRSKVARDAARTEYEARCSDVEGAQD